MQLRFKIANVYISEKLWHIEYMPKQIGWRNTFICIYASIYIHMLFLFKALSHTPTERLYIKTSYKRFFLSLSHMILWNSFGKKG